MRVLQEVRRTGKVPRKGDASLFAANPWRIGGKALRKGFLTSLALGMLLFSMMFSGNALAGEAAQEYRWVFAERERLLGLFENEGADAAPALAEALQAGENAFLHRTAAHLLVRLGEPALEGIEKALEHGDFQVRRIAIDGLAGMGMLPRYWDRVAGDEHPSIRRYARLVLRDKHIGGEGPDLVMDGFAVANPKGSPEVRLNVVKAVAETPARSPEAREMLVESTPKASEAHLLRGRAYYQLDEGEEADADPKAPVLSRPETGGNASNRRMADVWPMKMTDFRNNLRPFLDKFFNDF